MPHPPVRLVPAWSCLCLQHPFHVSGLLVPVLELLLRNLFAVDRVFHCGIAGAVPMFSLNHSSGSGENFNVVTSYSTTNTKSETGDKT